MTEVLVAAIGALGLVLVAVINTRTNRRVKAIQRQVQNDHTTNLREELDDRHDEIGEWLREVRRDIGGMREELRGVRSVQRISLDAQNTMSARIHALEQKGSTP